MCSHHTYLYSASLAIPYLVDYSISTLMKVREDSKELYCHRHQPSKFHHSEMTPLSHKNEKKRKEKERGSPFKRSRVHPQGGRNSLRRFHIHVQNG